MKSDDQPVELTVSEARSRLAEIIERTRQEHRPVYLTRRKRRVAAIVDAVILDNLIELAEDMIDIKAAAEARREMEETAAEPIPWEQVKADLGLA